MEEKLAIASHNNHNELLNQKSEILNLCRHKKLAVGYIVTINFILFITFYVRLFIYIYIYIYVYIIFNLFIYLNFYANFIF